MADVEKLIGKCKSYKIVSFDVFDTLLKRDVYSPGDVFSLVEIQYDSANAIQSSFSIKRRNAEKKARENSAYDEITFEEIYDQIDFTLKEKEELKQLELQVESSVLHANYEMLPLFRELIEKGKEIYLVSDMYLPSDFIRDILKRENITGYKKLYLSCDYRKTKRSGELFRVLCEEEHLNPKNVLHIGDSRYADYLGPRKVGMHSVHIQRRTMCTLYMNKPKDSAEIAEKCLYSFINSRTSGFDNRAVSLGFEVLGPIIYSYCIWLHDSIASEKGHNKIWFAARDMYLFSKAYNHLFPSDEATYVYLSRKSLRPLYALSLGNIARSGDVFARGKYSLREIIQYLGYSLNDVDITSDMDIDSKKYDIRELDMYPEVVKALTSDMITKTEEERSKLEEQYLKNCGLFDNRISFADVGWHGTTQLLLNAIQKQNGGNCSISGFYIGCLDGTIDKIGSDNYKTLLFDEDTECLFKKGIILFESLILAPHGSTVGYVVTNNEIQPILSRAEDVSFFIECIQKGAMAFVNDYSNSILSKTIQIDPCSASAAFEKLTSEPHRIEVEAIGDIEYDNFYCNKMAAPRKLSYYFLHVSDFKHDFKYSPWRIGFLYRLFKIRLPYAKLYSYVRRRMGKQT